jgi:tRNA pseudouridine55 synthase
LLHTKGNFTLSALQEGTLLLIDKPLNWTSFDVVNRIRVAICKHYNIKKLKIGHAGTLDPLATGLLILCTGKWTKKIDSIQAQVKGYSGTIQMGYTTASYDMETEPVEVEHDVKLNSELVAKASIQFTGVQNQLPPIFSAIKKEGKRAYDLARQGKEVAMDPRQIEIFDLQLKWDGSDEISFNVVCSKGTYIRSLAHDIGQFLGTGAYLSALRRTSIGDYSVDKAESLEVLLSNFN